ncbi:efflux RND transporter periplasmic adaptor subunit [Pseudogemmobacter sp. W21_MBD1_M6]|uniref:efflux RND transporter periplasmic adaptor subunit n=1 Tax=Pseudogemmobacter sp. W21_MBD1_M6 TaxID=3240271 RepID=UPI003F94EED1
MRFLPLLIAVLVSGSLYLLVFERERLLGFATTGAPEAVQAEQPSPVKQPAPDTNKAVLVAAMVSTAKDIENAVLVRGQTEAARAVEVRAETSGLVISEPKRKGSFVSAGEPLCQLDPGTRGASLSEAQARLAEATINTVAANKLAEGGFASETRKVSAEATLQSAQAGVAAAQTEISRLTIAAPFEGLLETDTAELGSLLQPGALCANVIQLDPIKLVGFVPETDVDKVNVGSMARARLASGTQVAGRVTFLSRSADVTTRTFRVEIQVPNADLAIRDGQTAEIVIASNGLKAHLLPQSAMVLNDEGAIGVRIASDDSRAEFVPVTPLRDTVEGIWVTGLPETAKVIVVGQDFVTDGVKLDVTLQETQQ